MVDEPGIQPTVPQWVEPQPGETGVTTETASRHMRFVRVTPNELDDLKNANTTLELAFFGISFGALVTIGTTLKLVQLTDVTTHAVFVGLVVLFSLSSAYFGIATVRGERRWRKKIEDLKRGC